MDEQRRTFSFQGKWELTYSVVLGSMVKMNGMNEAKETQAGYQEVLHITAIRGNGDRATWQARRNQAEKILAIGNFTARQWETLCSGVGMGAWGQDTACRMAGVGQTGAVVTTKVAVSACYISEQ